MPRRVGNDELALVGGKVAVGHINGDALLAFGAQAIGEEGEVNLALTGGAVLDGIFFDGRELIVVDALVSWRRRPMSVDLPSSTEPQVRRRRSSFRWWRSR